MNVRVMCLAGNAPVRIAEKGVVGDITKNLDEIKRVRVGGTKLVGEKAQVNRSFKKLKNDNLR